MEEGLSLPKIDVNEKELAALEQSSQMVMEMAQRVASSIVDGKTCEEAQKWCSERLTFAKNLKEKSWLAGIRETWHKQHASVCAIIKKYADPHEIAVRKIVDPAINIFLDVERARAAEAQKKLDEEAKKREEEIRLAKAEQLAKQGKTAEADAVLSRPINVVAPKVEAFKPTGMAQRKTWKVDELDDEAKFKLIVAVRDGHLPQKVLTVNMTELNKLATSFSGKLPKAVEGVINCREVTTNAHGRAA